MTKLMKKTLLHYFDINNLLIFTMLSIKASIFFEIFPNAFIEIKEKQFSKISNKTILTNKTEFSISINLIIHFIYFFNND